MYISTFIYSIYYLYYKFYVGVVGVKKSVYFRSEKLKRVSKYIPNQIYSAVSMTLTPAAGWQ